MAIGLRANTTTQRQAHAIQDQLRQERLRRGVPRGLLAEQLGVCDRTVMDWEMRYDSPGLEHLFYWAFEFGLRLQLQDRLRGPAPAARAPLSDGLWERRESYRLCGPLKARRQHRRFSQTDLALIIGVSRSSMQRWEDGVLIPSGVLKLVVWADRLDYSLILARMPEGDTSWGPGRAPSWQKNVSYWGEL